jgi:CheY-like chemotaxis protein
VLFPLLSADEAPPLAVPARPAEQGRDRAALSGLALVIDDEEPVRSLAKRALEMLGLRVEALGDSEAGLAYFREHAQEVAIVLLDLTMPKIDGAAVLREMKGIRPDAKILLSSGYNQQEVTRRFSSSELAGFIQKPYRIAAFQAEVRRILGGG